MLKSISAPASTALYSLTAVVVSSVVRELYHNDTRAGDAFRSLRCPAAGEKASTVLAKRLGVLFNVCLIPFGVGNIGERNPIALYHHEAHCFVLSIGIERRIEYA